MRNPLRDFFGAGAAAIGADLTGSGSAAVTGPATVSLNPVPAAERFEKSTESENLLISSVEPSGTAGELSRLAFGVVSKGGVDGTLSNRASDVAMFGAGDGVSRFTIGIVASAK